MGMQTPCASDSHGVKQDELSLKLGRALLRFQDRLLEGNITPGSLCQVWMPGQSEEGGKVLKAKGQPYCVAGVVDLLALFRCISCRYCFSTDITKPELLGAPGRVFTSRQPEMTRNVQQQSKDVYLRAQEAMHCRVHSTLVLPLYTSACRDQVAGVLEVIQTSEDMVFAQLVDILAEELEKCCLYTVDELQRDQMRKKVPEHLAVSGSTSKGDNSTHVSTSQNDSTNGSPKSIRNIPAAEGASTEGVDENSSQHPSTLYQRLPEMGDGSIRGGLAVGVSPFIHAQQAHQPELGTQMRGSSAAAAMLQLNQAPSMGMVTRNAGQAKATKSFGGAVKPLEVEDSKTSSYYDDEEIGSEDADGWDDDLEDSAEGVTDEARLANRRRGKGTGNPGKPGKKLRLADLQSQFGVGLKEAANKLGICPTTLKRACRRHGIQRWPRRQLARLTRAIDQIRSSGAGANTPVPAVDRPLRSSSRGKAASDEPILITSPAGSMESLPSHSGGPAFSEPGPDTRWTALDQLVPNFDHSNDSDKPADRAAEENMRAPAPAPSSHRQTPLAVSPSLLPGRCQDSPSAPLSYSPALIAAEPQAQDGELGLQLGLQSLSAADAWTVPLKDDPWAEQTDKLAPAGMSVDTLNRSMQLDGDDSMSFGNTITCSRQNEEESVHGAHAFQQGMAQQLSRPGLMRSRTLAPVHGSHPFQLGGSSMFAPAGLSIPGARNACRGLPASHNPHAEEGMLAQSLEAAIPQGLRRMPQSLPSMLSAYTQGDLRHSMAMFGQGSLAHSISMGNILQPNHLQLQQENFALQQEACTPTLGAGLTAHLAAFDMLRKDDHANHGQHHFVEGNGMQAFAADDVAMHDGLMDGDMLEMLLPEEA